MPGILHVDIFICFYIYKLLAGGIDTQTYLELKLW